MAVRLDPVVFCEGIDGGPDGILLEATRMALLDTHPLAERIEIRPAGSHANLTPLLEAFQTAPVPSRALCDRDFELDALCADFHADGPPLDPCRWQGAARGAPPALRRRHAAR